MTDTPDTTRKEAPERILCIKDLAAERDEARARAAAAYEAAARRAQYYERILPRADQSAYGLAREEAASDISALATDAERDALTAALERARTEEREACAKVAEDAIIDGLEGLYDLAHPYDQGWVRSAKRITATIRARGKGDE
jgi:hypothetical protein